MIKNNFLRRTVLIITIPLWLSAIIVEWTILRLLGKHKGYRLSIKQSWRGYKPRPWREYSHPSITEEDTKFQGAIDFALNCKKEENPYPKDSVRWNCWNEGWGKIYEKP